MHIQLESPDQPDVRRLIDELDAYQVPLYPAESHHGIDMQALTQPHVLFAVARADDGKAIGCGALVVGARFGEIKRMYVQPQMRGAGVAGAILAFLEARARAAGCASFALETGYLQDAAIGLYQRHGYRRCGPFGDYQDDPNSVFMHKEATMTASDAIDQTAAPQ